MRALFLCSRNKLRSPTAEFIFAGQPGIETDSAGLAKDAEIRLSEEQIAWAEIIFVMERIHRSRLNQKFPRALKAKKIVVLGIPDRYNFMDEKLIDILKEKCAPYFR